MILEMFYLELNHADDFPRFVGIENVGRENFLKDETIFENDHFFVAGTQYISENKNHRLHKAQSLHET